MVTNSNDSIVLVAPTAKRPNRGYNSLMDRFDKPKILSNQLLMRTLKSISNEVFRYSSFEKFVDNIRQHTDHLVLPFHYHVGSRSNNSFTQSFCEAQGIRFVGPEAYALTVCNDKVLSKDICRNAKILTPNCVVLFNEKDEIYAEHLSAPFIVKPVYEGNSIGIDSDSKCESIREAVALARALNSKTAMPVMIEEFIEGEEINVCIIGDHRSAPRINSVSMNKKSEIFDYNHKHNRINFNRYVAYDHPLLEEINEACLNIFNLLGKVEFMRFDFIVSGDKFYCIELTPDADISVNSALHKSVSKSHNYKEFIRLLISNSNQYHKNR